MRKTHLVAVLEVSFDMDICSFPLRSARLGLHICSSGLPGVEKREEMREKPSDGSERSALSVFLCCYCQSKVKGYDGMETGLSTWKRVIKREHKGEKGTHTHKHSTPRSYKWHKIFLSFLLSL